MKLARVGVIAAAVLAVATLAWAQKADFSGTWTLDAEASGAPAGGGGGGGGRGGGRGGGLGQGGVVKQTADTLSVERTVGDNKVTATYKLDGTESKISMGQMPTYLLFPSHTGRSFKYPSDCGFLPIA